jgi:hypothetical protein
MPERHYISRQRTALKSSRKSAIGWASSLDRNQVLEEVHTKIQVLNEEVAVTMDPIEQQQKFDQIQQADNELNSLYEAQSIAKKELHEFSTSNSNHLYANAPGRRNNRL